VSPDDSSMMLFGPGVKNITVANMTKAIRSECDMGPHAIFGRTCFSEAGFPEAGFSEALGSSEFLGRFDSSMTAMPPTTVTMPANRSGPKVSPNTTLEAAEPTNGTKSANGTTCAAG
jgi:hypothetical protein